MQCFPKYILSRKCLSNISRNCRQKASVSMPHRKEHTPEATYRPEDRDETGDAGGYDNYIDDLEGFSPEDFDEEELAEIEHGTDLADLAAKKIAEELGDDAQNAECLFDEYEYLSVPKIPQDYRASDIIGKRTQASSKSNAIPMGEVKPKARLRDIWNSLTDVEKYILMLVSEHRHMTQAQLSVLVVTSAQFRRQKGCVNATKAYYEWVTKEKYKVEGMNYKNTFKTFTLQGLAGKMDGLVKAGLLEEIIPAYAVDERQISDRYIETPSLFTRHYYLTPLGAKVLVCNTDINRNGSRVKPVGYVPTYKNAAYQTILHEAESTEVLCSIISCAQYASNPDGADDYGLFDVCRFYHEKDVEEKGVVYKGKKINFKTDGKLTVYVDSLGDFIDWYIEYDSGSSTADKIRHKTEAFIKYIFWQREKFGPRFRKPVLLLVTQKPADMFPQLTGKKSTTYTTGVKNMACENFPEYMDILNDIAIVLVADCGSIRQHGALGACWHKVDLTTGIADTKAYDLIAASSGISRGLAEK